MRRSGVLLWNYRIGVQVYPTDRWEFRVFTYRNWTRGIYFMLGRYALTIFW